MTVYTREEADELRRRRIARRERDARLMLRSVSGGHPNTPELTDEQLLAHARCIVDRARVMYEEWKVAEGYIPQNVSKAAIAFRTAYIGATEKYPPDEEDADVAGS